MLYVFFPQEVDSRLFLALCPSTGTPPSHPSHPSHLSPPFPRAPGVNSVEESGVRGSGQIPALTKEKKAKKKRKDGFTLRHELHWLVRTRQACRGQTLFSPAAKVGRFPSGPPVRSSRPCTPEDLAVASGRWGRGRGLDAGVALSD